MTKVTGLGIEEKVKFLYNFPYGVFLCITIIVKINWNVKRFRLCSFKKFSSAH